MSEMPAGTILGERQSWNKQHSYVQTEGKHCNKAALLAALESSGKEALTFLKEQSKAGVAVPPYSTFRLWVIEKEANAKGGSTKINPSTAIPSTPEAIKAEIARLQDAYRESLLAKVKALEAEIEKLSAELKIAKKDLEDDEMARSLTECSKETPPPGVHPTKA